MKMRYWLLFILGLGLGTVPTETVSGQTAMQKLMDGFAGRKISTPPPAKRESETRLIEILVELAWLGDPITFPFYLEAHVEGTGLRVRGNVPSKSVHEHALKLAQMNTPLPLADGLKENPRLAVRPTRMTPDQLEKVVRSALRESVPSLAKNLQTRCTADGQVAVLGNVENFEQKLLISQTLRRLHGCTVAINLTRVSYDPDGKLVRNLIRPPTPSTQLAKTDVVNNGPLAVPQQPGEGNRETLTPPPAIAVNTPASIPILMSTPVPPPEGPRLTPVQLQKRIRDLCPKATDVRVTLEPTGEHKLEIHVREDADVEVCLNRVYSVPDLESYRLDPHFVIDAVKK